MIIHVERDKRTVKFITQYNFGLIAELKKVGARWDEVGKYWYVRVNELDVVDSRALWKRFQGLVRFCKNGAAEKLIKVLKELGQVEAGRVENVDVVVPQGLELFPFQVDGVRDMLGKGKRVLLADEMGAGKTIEAIAYTNVLMQEKEVFPLVLVCPAVVKLNWEREIKKWCVKSDIRVQVLQGRSDELRNVDVYILNYDVVDAYKNKFRDVKGLILDECHYIKNRSAKRTKAVYHIVKLHKLEYILALSGTPLLNRPVELWTTLNLLKPSVFGNFWNFALRYCGAYQSQWGWMFNGATNVEELAKLLKQTVMVRREKKDVLKDLPAKMRVVMPLDVDDGGKLRRLEEKVKQVLDQLEQLQGELEQRKSIGDKEGVKSVGARMRAVWNGSIGEIEEYRKEAVVRKLPFMYEFIENCLEQEDKLVVFTYHRDIWEEVMKRYGDVAVGIVGGDDVRKRDEVIRKFQEDAKVRLFVGAIRACGEGITLTSANKAVFVEYDWTPAKMLQAEDRLHRIGQKSTVYSYWFVLKDSIDEYFVKKILDKVKVIEKVLDVKEREEFILFDLSA